MDPIALLVIVIIIGLVFWALGAIAGAFSIPSPIVVVIQVILVMFVVLYLLRAFGLISGGPILRL